MTCCEYRRGNDDLRSLLAGLTLLIHASTAIRTHHVDVVHLTELLRLVINLTTHARDDTLAMPF